MFSIVTNQVMEDCLQLEQCVSQLKTENMEMESIIREIGSLSGMDEVMTRLKSQHSGIREEIRILRQMMLGLDKTVLYYMNCERRICENVEQSMIQYVRREVGMNDFSQIADLLGKIL